MESFNCFLHHVNKRPDSPSPEMLTCVIKAECCDLSPAAADVKNPCDPSTSLRSPSPQETLRSTRNWPKDDQLDNSRYFCSPKKIESHLPFLDLYKPMQQLHESPEMYSPGIFDAHFCFVNKSQPRRQQGKNGCSIFNCEAHKLRVTLVVRTQTATLPQHFKNHGESTSQLQSCKALKTI